MEPIYRLSPGAILYAVLRLHKSGMYGLLDVFSAIPDAQFPTCIQNAEQELLEKDCGRMDFDGNFDLDAGFAALVSGCAEENSVLQIDRRIAGRQERMTCYLHRGTALTQVGAECLLDPEAKIPGTVLEFLDLPAESENLEEITVDSGLVAAKNAAGLKEAGCSEKTARLIAASVSGEGGYAQLVRVTDKVQTELLALAWGKEGVMMVEVEYTGDHELIHFTPLTARSAGDRIAAMAKL